MITMDDVKEWAIEKKRKYTYGHILMSARDYWVVTLCGTMTPNWQRTKSNDDFDRICPKCKKNMDKATVAKDNKEGGG